MLAAKVIEYPEARHTRFVWEGMRLLQEIGPAPDAEGKIRQNGNARVRSWIYEPDGTGYVPLAAMDQALGKNGVGKARIHYIHTDHLGTPQEVTDAEGKIEWSADYSAWGEKQHSLVLNSEEEAERRTDCAIRFQGQYFDAETGLHYNTFRYYDPGCGRFISPDPINIQGGLNLYRYAPNAANWIDPWGWKGDYHEMPVIPGHQRHHNIPQELANHPAIKSSGYDVHNSRNITQLPTDQAHDPTRTVHRGGNSRAYVETIEEALNKINDLNASPEIKRMHIQALSDKIGKGLRSNALKLNKAC
jgi:RHS repeat-associated protein